MGVEPFLVTSAVNMILAQRLARKVCKECAAPDPDKNVDGLVEAGMSREEAEAATPMRGQGCKVCNEMGYKGRVALYEVMVLDEALKDLILQGASTAELKHEAIRLGMITLRRAGLNKVIEGMTTLEEVTRVTAAD